ncbi:hypothetical protein B0H16DRAFT_1495468 [Mycena metata]|uniref:F-box domain-containing protein n=1 Tax=Mycena metata TaxID=1033252 RepID=A0AAD7KDJ6_9AGAR|nr:hypothetical protein B0H16DRAFT_1495468 [Mycena metata]
MRSPATLFDIPDELLLDIFSRIPRHDLITMLRVTSWIHFVAARAVYTNVRVVGLNARRFFVTLASRSQYSVVYSTFIRRLRYTFTSASESYLTFPVFCQALLTMECLVSLSLDIFAPHADTLILSLQRYGLLRSRVLIGAGLLAAVQGHRSALVTAHTLPNLRALRLRGGPAIAGVLTCHRAIEELVLSTPLDYIALSELCTFVDRNIYGNRLVTLIIRLTISLDVQDVIMALSEVVPHLQQLSLDQPRLNPLPVLRVVAGSSPAFALLRRLSLNVASSWQTGIVIEGGVSAWLASEIAPHSHLAALSIGTTVWMLDIMSYKWISQPRIGTILRLNYFQGHM